MKVKHEYWNEFLFLKFGYINDKLQSFTQTTIMLLKLKTKQTKKKQKQTNKQTKQKTNRTRSTSCIFTEVIIFKQKSNYFSYDNPVPSISPCCFLPDVVTCIIGSLFKLILMKANHVACCFPVKLLKTFDRVRHCDPILVSG
jgi:hypothetical protein